MNSHASGYNAVLADMSETDVLRVSIEFTPLSPEGEITDFTVKFCKDNEEEKGKKSDNHGDNKVNVMVSMQASPPWL